MNRGLYWRHFKFSDCLIKLRGFPVLYRKILNGIGLKAIVLMLFCCFFPLDLFAQGCIAYVYPAGGKQGTTFEIVVSGNGVNAQTKDVFVNGDGVHFKFKRACFGGVRFFNASTAPVFEYLYRKAMNRCFPDQYPQPKELVRVENPKPEEVILVPEQKILDENPWCNYLADNVDIEIQSKILSKIYYEYMTGKDERQSMLTPFIFYEVTIDPDARPGLREIRFFQKEGGRKLSTPFFFEVTPYNEVCEIEPNDSIAIPEKTRPGRWGFHFGRERLEPQETPVIFNGQVCAGEWDYLSFKAKKGQKLILGVKGRSIVPYMADAVPGWFSPVITLYTSNGKRIASESRFRFSPDPILFFDVPEDGIYYVEIRDVIYRGREDFVYRLFIGEFPFVRSTSILGTVRDTSLVRLDGWNLPTNQIDLKKVKRDNRKGKEEKIFEGIEEPFWTVDMLGDTWLPWPLKFANDDMTAFSEEYIRAKAKESGREKIVLKTPVLIDGLISQDDEEDIWYFNGDAGKKLVLEVVASQLGSPVEPGVELFDETGRTLIRGDDRAGAEGPNIGQETHHADPLVGWTIAKSGEYGVRVYNVFGKGGPEFRYRLRISRPIPDFTIFATPSFINPGSGNSFQVKLNIDRKDGFNGPIKLYAKSLYGLFTVDGDVQEGVRSQFSTVTSNSNFPDLSPFYLIAEANSGKKRLLRLVTPCEDMEQAFIYHHSIPCRSFSIYKPGRSDLFFWPKVKEPLELVPGQEVKCTIWLPDLPEMDPKKAVKTLFIQQKLQHKLHFTLKEPKGILIEKIDVRESAGEVDLFFRLDTAGELWRKAPPVGNIIVNIECARKSPEAESAGYRLNDRGPIPAIPYRISETPSQNKKKQ